MEEFEDAKDFVILVENNSIPCSKDVLSKQSDYFRALFSSQMTECLNNSVTVKDVSYETVLSLVNCMNTGHLTLKEDTLSNTVQAAVRFQIPLAIESCESYMLMNLDDTNCFFFYQTAKTLCLKKLYNKAKRHILYYFTSLTLSEEFLNLELADVVEYLSDKQINCERESKILDAINYWIYHDYETRIELLDELLKCFHGEDLLPSEWEQIGLHQILTDTDAGKKWLLANEGNKIAACPKKAKNIDNGSQIEKDEQIVDDKETKKPNYRQLPLMFLAVGGLNRNGQMSQEVLRFDDLKQDFCPYQNLNHGKISRHFKITSIGKDMYITGGQSIIGKSETFNMDVWKFDAFNEEWSVVTRLPTPCRHHAACASNSSLYLLSGFGKFRQKLESFQEYDTIQGKWHDLPSMPEACPYSNAVCCSDKLFVYTGSYLYTYSFSTNSWTSVTNVIVSSKMKQNVQNFCPIMFDRLIYYFPLQSMDLTPWINEPDMEMEVFVNITPGHQYGRMDSKNFELETFHSAPKGTSFGNNVVMVGERFYMVNYNSKDLMSWSVYNKREVKKLGTGKNVGHRCTLVALVSYPKYEIGNKIE